MTVQDNISKYPPGSKIADTLGCKCPVLDNSYGEGAYGGGVKDENGQILYWISENCPLHNGAMQSVIAIDNRE